MRSPFSIHPNRDDLGSAPVGRKAAETPDFSYLLGPGSDHLFNHPRYRIQFAFKRSHPLLVKWQGLTQSSRIWGTCRKIQALGAPSLDGPNQTQYHALLTVANIPAQIIRCTAAAMPLGEESVMASSHVAKWSTRADTSAICAA